MLDITDKSYKPDIYELGNYVENPLFMKLFDFLSAEYGARCDIAYSGDNVLLGWNVKLYKSGRTLCRLYPRKNYFSVLVVVGRKEKERAEALLPQMSDEMRGIYESTKEGMEQRWLVFDIHEDDDLFRDFLKLVEIRRNS